MDETYPRFQWSKFLSDGEQVVVRAQSIEELTSSVEDAKIQFGVDGEKKLEPTQPREARPAVGQTTVSQEVFHCRTCGAEAVLKSGISKKGNAYKIMKCSENEAHDYFIK